MPELRTLCRQNLRITNQTKKEVGTNDADQLPKGDLFFESCLA
jgi:hypothetical protein